MSNDPTNNTPANFPPATGSNTGGPAPLHQIELKTHVPERHQTELEKWATDAYSNSQVLLDEQGNRIMLWVSLILLLLAAIIFYNRSSKAGSESSWQSMFLADSPAKYKEVAETSADTVVGALASLKEGDALVFSATENMFKDRETSKTELADAKKAYERAAKSPFANDDIKQRAELGLATIIELQSSGDLTSAIKAYEEVSQKFPNTAIGNIAQERVKSFKDNKDAVAFYNWFATQNPKPPVRDEPKDQPATNKEPSTVPISPDLPASTDMIPGLKDKPADVTPDFLKSLEKLPQVEGKPTTPKTGEPVTEPANKPAESPQVPEPTKSPEPTISEDKPK
jgi:hypothetical protein